MKLEFTDALLLGNRVPEKDVPSLNVTDMLLEFGNTVAEREAPLWLELGCAPLLGSKVAEIKSSPLRVVVAEDTPEAEDGRIEHASSCLFLIRRLRLLEPSSSESSKGSSLLSSESDESESSSDSPSSG